MSADFIKKIQIETFPHGNWPQKRRDTREHGFGAIWKINYFQKITLFFQSHFFSKKFSYKCIPVIVAAAAAAAAAAAITAQGSDTVQSL